MGKKYSVETFGCQMNVHDSERLSGLLENSGYELGDSADRLDLLVINTCSVRERAAEKLFARLDRFRNMSLEARPTIAVTGCVAQQEGDKILERAPVVDVIIGTQAIEKLPVAIESSEESGESYVDINPYDNVSFPLGVVKRNDSIKAYITIIEGCNDFCSFCVVPYTRGRERMRPAVEILEEAKGLAAEGCREVHLLGQIVNHYHAPDIPGFDFPELLQRLQAISGIDRIRFASPHPRHVSARMIEAVATLPKVCKHMHLPVQSGSTRVLSLMRRRHTRERYLSLIRDVRKQIPGINLSTDLIVGFPGETIDDFKDTLSLVRKVNYHSIFSFKYSKRPQTLASQRMTETVSEDEKSKRLTELQALQKEIQVSLHDQMVGSVCEVLVDSKSRRRDGEFCGRTNGNVIVNFPAGRNCIGRIVAVEIIRAGPNSVWGKQVSS